MAKYEAGDEILFEDIKLGDKIRRTTTYEDGGTSIYEGVVARQSTWDHFYWDTQSGITLAFKNDDDDDRVLVEFLGREVPKLPTETGTVIKARKVRGTVGEFVLYFGGDNNWRSMQLIEDAEYGGSYYWHVSESIEDWTEMELVEKKS